MDAALDAPRLDSPRLCPPAPSASLALHMVGAWRRYCRRAAIPVHSSGWLRFALEGPSQIRETSSLGSKTYCEPLKVHWWLTFVEGRRPFSGPAEYKWEARSGNNRNAVLPRNSKTSLSDRATDSERKYSTIEKIFELERTTT